MRYGINKKTVDNQFLTDLSLKGCLPAYCFMEEALNQSYKESTRLKKLLDHLDGKEKQILKQQNPLAKYKVAKSLMDIRKDCEELPIKALMNENNSETLNLRIFKLSKKKKLIKNIQNEIRYEKLGDYGFIKQDYRLLRRSIIWLNWFYFRTDLKTRPRNDSLCLSNDAMQLFVMEGTTGLIKAAKKEKIELKEALKKMTGKEKELRGFLSSASYELAGFLKNKLVFPRDLQALRNAIEFFGYQETARELDKLSTFFLLHPEFEITKVLNKLSNIGYIRIFHLKCLKKECEIICDYDLMISLHKNFHSFSF